MLPQTSTRQAIYLVQVTASSRHSSPLLSKKYFQPFWIQHFVWVALSCLDKDNEAHVLEIMWGWPIASLSAHEQECLPWLAGTSEACSLICEQQKGKGTLRKDTGWWNAMAAQAQRLRSAKHIHFGLLMLKVVKALTKNSQNVTPRCDWPAENSEGWGANKDRSVGSSQMLIKDCEEYKPETHLK